MISYLQQKPYLYDVDATNLVSIVCKISVQAKAAGYLLSHKMNLKHSDNYPIHYNRSSSAILRSVSLNASHGNRFL